MRSTDLSPHIVTGFPILPKYAYSNWNISWFWHFPSHSIELGWSGETQLRGIFWITSECRDMILGKKLEWSHSPIYTHCVTSLAYTLEQYLRLADFFHRLFVTMICVLYGSCHILPTCYLKDLRFADIKSDLFLLWNNLSVPLKWLSRSSIHFYKNRMCRHDDRVFSDFKGLCNTAISHFNQHIQGNIAIFAHQNIRVLIDYTEGVHSGSCR